MELYHSTLPEILAYMISSVSVVIVGFCLSQVDNTGHLSERWGKLWSWLEYLEGMFECVLSMIYLTIDMKHPRKTYWTTCF